MNKQVITIDTIVIKQDAEGRYCLNDFHKAAGGAEKDKPVQFLRYQQAEALIEELKVGNHTFSPVVAVKGRNGGTFVVKELVYAYAMWISPQFHLKVIPESSEARALTTL